MTIKKERIIRKDKVYLLVVTLTKQQIIFNKAACLQSSKALMYNFHCLKKKRKKEGQVPITAIWYGATFLQIMEKWNCGIDYHGPPAFMPHSSSTVKATLKNNI